MAKAIASLLVLLLAACSDNSGGPAAPEGAESNASPPRPASPGAAAFSGGTPVDVSLPRLAGSAAGDAAALRGRLAVEGPCLYVETDAGRYLVAALAPSLTWDRAERRLRSGTGSFAVGDPVVLGGSEAGGSDVSWAEAPHRTCNSGRIWIATAATAR